MIFSTGSTRSVFNMYSHAMSVSSGQHVGSTLARENNISLLPPVGERWLTTVILIYCVVHRVAYCSA